MKKFKRRKNYFKYVVLIFIIVILYFIISTFVLKIKLTSSNEEFLRELLKDSNHHLAYENNNSLSSYFLKLISRIDIENPISILNSFFGYDDVSNFTVVSADSNVEPAFSDYVLDPT